MSLSDRARKRTRTHNTSSLSSKAIQIDENTQLYHQGKPQELLKNAIEGKRYDCPISSQQHSDNGGLDYSHGVRLRGGDIGVACSGSCSCTYIPKHEFTQEEKKEYAKRNTSQSNIKHTEQSVKDIKPREGFFMTPTEYKKIEDQEYIIDRFLPKGGLFMLVGESGHGKSWLAYMLVNRAVSSNESMSAIFIDIDSGAVYNKQRVQILWKRYGTERFKYASQHTIDGAEAIGYLSSLSKVDLKNQIIVLDSLSSFILKGSFSKDDDVRPFMKLCEELRNRGATVILLHHTKKGKDEDTGERVYAGSLLIKKTMDAMYVVEKSDKVITCHLAKSRGDYISRTFEIENFQGMIANDVDYISPEQEKEAKKERAMEYEKQKVIEILSNSKDQPLKSELKTLIMTKISRTDRAANTIIKRLLEDKTIREIFGIRNEKKIALAYSAESSKIQKKEDDNGTPF